MAEAELSRRGFGFEPVVVAMIPKGLLGIDEIQAECKRHNFGAIRTPSFEVGINTAVGCFYLYVRGVGGVLR